MSETESVTNDLSQRMEQMLSHLPAHMREGAYNYVMFGQPPGDFLRAVLVNDLNGAAQKADGQNRHALFLWAQWLDHIPMICWGSSSAVERWIQIGGAVGHLTEKETTND